MFNLYVIRPYGFNIGNHVIFKSLKHLIKNNFPEDTNIISIPASSKYDSYVNSGLTSSTIHEINQYGHGVIVGGGNLFENGELDLDPQALRALRPPSMLFSVSWGRVYDSRGNLQLRSDSIDQNKLKKFLETTKIVVARDLATKLYLEDNTNKDVILGGCPTFFLKPTKIKNDYIKNFFSKTALISIRNPSLMSISPNHQSRIGRHIEMIIESLNNKGFTPVILCHDHRDISFASSFIKARYLYSEDVDEYLAYLNLSKLLITYRLHAFLPSVAFKKPSINIEYDERSSSLVKVADLAKLSINLFNSTNPFLEQFNEKMSFVENSFIDYLINTSNSRENLMQSQLAAFKNFRELVDEYKKGLNKQLV